MREYKEVELKKVVAESKTFREVLLKFERNQSSSSYKVLRKKIKEFKIDVTHFLNQSERIKEMYKKGLLVKKTTEEIFCENSTVSRSTVKKRIIDDSILKYKCKKCGQGEMWNGEKITLILDHINGVRNDNRIKNLRFMCPNCDATLQTFCTGSEGLEVKKKIDRRKIKKKYKPRMSGRKVERPNKEKLKKKIKTMSMCAIGREYGVSDNAVRKWAKIYKIL